MKQVKLFSSNTIEPMEQKVNDCLTNFQQRGFSIIDVLITESPYSMIVMIFYDTNVKP